MKSLRGLGNAALVLGFLLGPPAASSQPSAAEPAALSGGRELYARHCAACHGENGDGNGPAAVWLYPKPRHFNSGLFKIKSTPAGALPTDDDLTNTVTRGMPGSSMPGFTYLTEPQRRDVVQYVKYLTAYVDASGKRVNFFEQEKAQGPAGQPIQVPPEPPATVQAVARGQELYGKLNCFTCHGLTGEGTGPSAPSLKDFWGFSLPPRDFNTGPFRGGHKGQDLYLRIATGLAGTPMPAFDDKLVSPEDRWAVVHYVQSLRRKEIEINDILQPADDTIHATRVKKLPAAPGDPFWDRLDPVRIPLNPLWPEADLIPAVAVRAVHDGKRVAIFCQWRDPIVNGAPVRVQDFQDAIAVQFPLTGGTPFLGMGDAKNPVNIWQWKAGWQQKTEEARPDVNTVYVSLHVDQYPETKPLFRTAEAAGNNLAQPTHQSPVEDANARGFGTFTAQPAAGQNVQGQGIWRDEHWNVMFVRDLKSRDADDAKLAVGKPVPVAFAIWDGQNRDRNGRKVISNWLKLQLEP